MKDPISVVIITYNERPYIARCLESVCWADEIVVVDSYSTDGTQEICRDPSAPWATRIKFYQREWSGFKDQRNYALDQASHHWILVVDSDECCSPELAERVESILRAKDEDRRRAYKVRRQEYFMGHPIKWGIWNPSYQDRLYLKDGIRYVNEVHEYPKFDSEPGRIEEPLWHSPDFGPEKFLSKMNRYTTIEARDRFDQGQRTNWFRLATSGPAMFLKNYFYYKSYRDGYRGFVISLLEGVSRVVRHIKLWQLGQKWK